MFADGSAAYTLISIPAAAGLAAFGLIFVTYAAHCLLTIVIDSGCGNDEVRWPQDAFVDWILKPLYCIWLLFGWTVLFGVILLPFFLHDASTFFLVLMALVYVMFPITLLSSLSAKSWLALLYGPFLARFARWPFTFLFTLLVGAVPVGLAVVLTLLTAKNMLWIFPAFVLIPLAFLFYARLVGRYAWLVTHTRTKKKERKPKETEKEPAGVVVADPWAAPPEEKQVKAGPKPATVNEVRAKLLPVEALERLDDDAPEDEWTVKKKPYGVMTEPQAQASWQDRPTTPLDDPESYIVDDEPPPLAAPFSQSAYYENYAKEEEKRHKLAEPLRPKRPTFALAFGRGLFLFPFYGPSLRAWFNLAVLTALMLFCVRLLMFASEKLPW